MDYKQIAKGDPTRVPIRLYYIRGIIRNRLVENGYYYPDKGALHLIIDAWRNGVSIELLESLAKSIDVRTWTNFRDAVYEAMDDICDDEDVKGQQ